MRITPNQLMNIGLWNKFCEMRGYNPWCVNEGLMRSDEQVSLTETEALALMGVNDQPTEEQP